jgi:peptidoglycan/LPS O-acetylase OafA/YrhL
VSAAAFAVLVIYAAPNYSVPAVMLASACAFVCLAGEQDLLSPLLTSRALVYGGEISYSLYMFHWVVWSFLRRGLSVFFHQAQMPHVALMLTATILSFAVAAAAYHWIELPGRRILRSSRRGTAHQSSDFFRARMPSSIRSAGIEENPSRI